MTSDHLLNRARFDDFGTRRLSFITDCRSRRSQSYPGRSRPPRRHDLKRTDVRSSHRRNGRGSGPAFRYRPSRRAGAIVRRQRCEITRGPQLAIDDRSRLCGCHRKRLEVGCRRLAVCWGYRYRWRSLGGGGFDIFCNRRRPALVAHCRGGNRTSGAADGHLRRVGCTNGPDLSRRPIATYGRRRRIGGQRKRSLGVALGSRSG